jgi:xylulokinase
MWNFNKNTISNSLLEYYGIKKDLIPDIVPTFGEQGFLSRIAAKEIGLPEGISVSYRAGDQPNNAFSLNVLHPGEVAATAGTSGVVYGVSDIIKYDPQSRVNTFAHVNHSDKLTRLGVLLCVNGTGILNSWIRKNTGENISYPSMNELASGIQVGSEGLSILPFGNGAERILGNRNISSSIAGLSFNIHSKAHLYRAAQEGIAFALNYGMDVMKQTDIHPKVIRAGYANLFLSPVFRETLAGVTNTCIELYNTDGGQGAARAAGLGAGIYKSYEEAFRGLTLINSEEPVISKASLFSEAYEHWKEHLDRQLIHKI